MVATSRDVARLAGVSQPTVSRALRDSPKVSEQTKGRVREAAAALGYVPSETGRALSSGRTRRIGLLLTDLDNQFYPHVIAPMHRELEALDYQLVLQTESSDSGRVAERLLANALDGVLLATTTVDSVLPVRLRDRGVPFVYFNRTSSSVDADSAEVDVEPGLHQLAQRILELGHRRVGAIFGPRNTSTAEHRESALREALGAASVSIGSTLSHRGPFDVETGYAGARRLLEQDEPPTVIVCGNDVVAYGALNAAHDLGRRVPEDVSVAGFDDLPPARWPLLQLTTVAFDLNAMARCAAGLLVGRIEGNPSAPYRHERFPSRLVERRTLGAVP
jgi:LacI family transcriptional regulator